MAEELKDILSNLNNNDTDQETLLKYLNGQLGKEEMHEMEKNLLDNEFESDAVEGLQEMDQVKMQLMVEALNRDLKKRTAKKRTAISKRTLKPQWWLYFSIIIFLIILVLVYVYLKRSIPN